MSADTIIPSNASKIDEVTDRLIAAIAIGEYLPGSRLPAERALAESLRVGRMTVRAALARLAARGLLDTQRGRDGGSFVREQWPETSSAAVLRVLSQRWEMLRDTSDTVCRLYGVVAGAAAEHRTPDDIARLRERVAAFREAESGLPSQHADSLLHLAIFDAARSDTLREVIFDLESRISIATPSHLWGPPEGMRSMEERALRDHEALIDAIAAGDALAATAIGREHAKIDFELLESALHKAQSNAVTR